MMLTLELSQKVKDSIPKLIDQILKQSEKLHVKKV